MSFNSMTLVAGSNKSHSRHICLGLWSSGLNLATKLNSSLIQIFPKISKELGHGSLSHWDSGGLGKADSRSHPWYSCFVVSKDNAPTTIGTGCLGLCVQPITDKPGMMWRCMCIILCNLENTEHGYIKGYPPDDAGRGGARHQYCFTFHQRKSRDQEMQRCKMTGANPWG